MHKVAVIGDYDSIYGFSALGLDTFPVTDVTEAAHLLRKIAAGEYAIIYITEMLACLLYTSKGYAIEEQVIWENGWHGESHSRVFILGLQSRLQSV